MLKVKNMSKQYPTFQLKDVSFELEPGYIMGFIGANGAGKTTTMKGILNYIDTDGEVEIFGKNFKENEVELKQELGVSFGGVDFYPKNKVKTVTDIYKGFYKRWDEKKYREYLQKFAIDENKRICELSAGMAVKYGIALALSHDAKLIIFDEPTSGLDPIARDGLLDIFREIVESGERSVLFSTHVTSDLDKCADFIIFIREGELILNDATENIIESHTLVMGKRDALTEDLRLRLIGYKENSFGFTALMKAEDLFPTDTLETARPNLEDIMIYYSKEVSK